MKSDVWKRSNIACSFQSTHKIFRRFSWASLRMKSNSLLRWLILILRKEEKSKLISDIPRINIAGTRFETLWFACEQKKVVVTLDGNVLHNTETIIIPVENIMLNLKHHIVRKSWWSGIEVCDFGPVRKSSGRVRSGKWRWSIHEKGYFPTKKGSFILKLWTRIPPLLLCVPLLKAVLVIQSMHVATSTSQIEIVSFYRYLSCHLLRKTRITIPLCRRQSCYFLNILMGNNYLYPD